MGNPVFQHSHYSDSIQGCIFVRLCAYRIYGADIEKDSYIVGTRIYSRLGVGDIIIFHHDGKLLVKRIAAEEGEQVVHNGASLTVPEKSYYVLGDNAEHSLDSRYWEDPFVRNEEIVAKLIFY